MLAATQWDWTGYPIAVTVGTHPTETYTHAGQADTALSVLAALRAWMLDPARGWAGLTLITWWDLASGTWRYTASDTVSMTTTAARGVPALLDTSGTGGVSGQVAAAGVCQTGAMDAVELGPEAPAEDAGLPAPQPWRRGTRWSVRAYLAPSADRRVPDILSHPSPYPVEVSWVLDQDYPSGVWQPSAGDTVGGVMHATSLTSQDAGTVIVYELRGVAT